MRYLKIAITSVWFLDANKEFLQQALHEDVIGCNLDNFTVMLCVFRKEISRGGCCSGAVEKRVFREIRLQAK